MPILTELNLRLPNSPGALATVCGVLSTERVNIMATMLESNGQLHLVVDNHVHGAGVLRERHYQVVERDVILVRLPNTAGGLAPVVGAIGAAGVNVEYAYGAGPEGSASASVVLGVEDARRAAAAAGV
jgi:hypothetical protein